jgi:hypothetical protein
MSAALAVDTGDDAVSAVRSLSSVCSSRAGKSRFGFKAESVTPAASACTSPMLSPAPAADASDVADEDAPSSPRILRRRGNALPKPPPRVARNGTSVLHSKRSNNISDDETIQARIPLGVKRIRSSESVHTTDSERANRGAVPRKALAVKLPTRVTVAAAAAAAAHASSDASSSTQPPSPRIKRRDVNAGTQRSAPRSASKQNLHAAASGDTSAAAAGPSGYARTGRGAVGRGSSNTPRKQLRQSLQESRIRELAEMMFKLDDSGKHTVALQPYVATCLWLRSVWLLLATARTYAAL